MKRIEKPSTIFKYQGKVHEVTSIAEGKVIFHKIMGAEPCVACGHIYEYADLEHSLNFQERSEPVDTLET